jgi:hypothetical protein
MKELKTTWTGIRPLVMHNGELANPVGKFSRAIKEISSKRKKTESDFEAMARLEFEGGLYWDDKAGPILPSDCIEACIQGGAKKNKLGKDVQAAVFVQDAVVALKYDGPRSIEKLYAEPRFVLQKGVKVTTSRIIRTRPMFPTGWSISFTLEYDDTIINEAALKRSMVDAGALVGLGDWRPKFGRFIVS